jgi:D-alanyl-D-alanine carboxypeptidase (penicillin-binding protein 5/6)
VATALAIFLVVASEPTAAYVYEGLDSRGFFEDPAAALVYSKQKIMNFFNTAYGGEASADVGANGAQFDPGFESGGLYSSAALLAELDTGTVLLKKNAELRIYPASLTKMMTALLAAEYLDGLPEAISVDPSIFPGLYVANASMAGFMPGEEVRAEDLVYGVMVASGAECCIALAQAIAGSEEAFVEMMNARAKEIGMYGTHFTNSTGLHDPEHFSTARDMAKLLLIALSNELFESAFTAAAHTTAPTSMRPDGWLMESDVFAKMDAAGFPEGLVAGGKAGYTQEAGQCLASVAEKGGKRYIFVSTGNGVEKKGMAYSIEDALNVYSNALR